MGSWGPLNCNLHQSEDGLGNPQLGIVAGNEGALVESSLASPNVTIFRPK